MRLHPVYSDLVPLEILQSYSKGTFTVNSKLNYSTPQCSKNRRKNTHAAYLDIKILYDFSAAKFHKAPKTTPNLDARSRPLSLQK